MRTWMKASGVGLGIVVTLAAGAVLYVDQASLPHYPAPRLDLHVESTPERLARGRKIATLLCIGCHLDPATGRLTGRRLPDVPREFGVAYSSNITQDPTHGVGAWSDGELAYLLRTGVARDGRYTPPWMVKLPNASDEDIAAIIAFLRSDDVRVQATPVTARPSELSLLTKLLARGPFKPHAYPAAPIPAPPNGDVVAQGRYLAVNLLGCFDCHSADFKTNDPLHPERSVGFMGGGNPLLDMNGETVVSTNITPDLETGIGRWTEADFLRALKQGVRPDRSPIVYPMERYDALADDELRAIYAYLRTVPPLRNARPSAANGPGGPATGAATEARGRLAYHKYRCHSCHGETGLGLGDLRGADAKYANDADLIAYLRNPTLTKPDARMPALDGVVAEDDYPALVAHVRALGRASRGAGTD
jgi:mono/diheme cytochrome c family protein